MAHFTYGKNRILRNPNQSSFITIVFQLLLDMATLNDLSFRLFKATTGTYIMKLKTDIFYRILYAALFTQVLHITRPTAAVLVSYKYHTRIIHVSYTYHTRIIHTRATTHVRHSISAAEYTD